MKYFSILSNKEEGKEEAIVTSAEEKSSASEKSLDLESQNSFGSLAFSFSPTSSGLFNNTSDACELSTLNVSLANSNLTANDEELISILNNLGEEREAVIETAIESNGRLKGVFCSNVVFNLSKRKLNSLELDVLGKGLGFVPTPTCINESHLHQDFLDFSRKMRCKWYFRNNSNENSDESSFRVKSNWIPPKGNLALELFLQCLEKDLFKKLPGKVSTYNLSKEEWLSMRGLAEDRSVVIKPADKGSCVVVWDREDYLKEAKKQLQDQSIYVDTNFQQKELSKLVKWSNAYFTKLKNEGFLTEKELKYFLFNFKNSTNFGKLYFLPKIHKRVENVPGRPVISNCGVPTEKASKFSDFHLQALMRSSKSYIKDTNDFLKKVAELGPIPKNSILVTADVVG